MNLFSHSPLPEKIPLSGSDCFHLVLDKHARKYNAGDNVMRIVFYFDKSLSKPEIEERLSHSALIHWLCNIRLVTPPFFRKPYWKYTDGGRKICVHEHEHAEEFSIPETVLNRDIPIDAERFIECDIVRYPTGRSVLSLSWNHILMDGRGIGMLVNHLNELDETDGLSPQDHFPVAEKRTGIYRYIRNMYEVKRFIQDSSRLPIASIAGKNAKSSKHFSNRIIYFTREETALIDQAAFKHGARFGANLFYLSCCAHAVNLINSQRGTEGDLWLPIPYDGRLKGSKGPVISNFVAYLFYRLTSTELLDVKTTVGSMNRQMAEQLKTEMPRKYNMLLKMMRHFPLWLYYFLISRTGEGNFSSFLYSSTGNNFNQVNHLFGMPVKNLTIYPSSTFPPGLTFSFLRHHDALNINIAYSSDILSKFELDFLEEKMRNLLFAGC